MSETGRPNDSEISERIERRVLQACGAVGGFIEYWGFKAIHGKVWTLLALRKLPMGQSEIAETLGVSRSLMSSAISELHDYGLVRPTSDHRNAPWEAVMDVWPTIADVLRTREWMLLETARNALESALESVALNEEAGLSTPYDRGRLRLLLRMTELAQALLKLLISIRMPRGLEGLGDWVGRARSLVTSLRGLK